MDEHHKHFIERHCDVAIIGGSAAGLAAALQLGRQRRKAIVIDSGEPRNAPAAQMHSYLGHEGLPPSELAAIAREEVRSYGAEVLEDLVIDVERVDDRSFVLELESGTRVLARRVLAATGLIDELPEIDGLAEHWGGDVIHCPFCHGYEVRDRRLAQIVTHPMGLHTAGLFRQLSSQLTLVLHEGIDATSPEVASLRNAGVTVIDERVDRVLSGDDGRVCGVQLENGVSIDADAIAIGTRFRVRTDAFASLGVTPVAHPTGLGDAVEVDSAGETSVSGLYAAGNITDPSQQVLQAAADGSRIGGMISFSLVAEDVETSQRRSATEAEWDTRYAGDQVWSGNPNGSLVAEITELPAGRALDVGAGEGGDAVWLAERDWSVVANDISQHALTGITAVAAERDLNIDVLQADANDLDPFGDNTFDLVTAHYASIPRSADDRAIDNLLAAVAPGGTLLVVGHAPDPTDHGHPRAFDPYAYVRVDDFAARLTPSEWTVVTLETRERPEGAASHHRHDVVLRATRHSA